MKYKWKKLKFRKSLLKTTITSMQVLNFDKYMNFLLFLIERFWAFKCVKESAHQIKPRWFWCSYWGVDLEFCMFNKCHKCNRERKHQESSIWKLQSPRRPCYYKLARGSLLGHVVLLLDINSLTEHQHQRRSLWDHE